MTLCISCVLLWDGTCTLEFHDAERCWKNKQFTDRLQDPEYRDPMMKRLAKKSKSAREDKASGQPSSQSNSSGNLRNDRQAQTP